VFSTIATVAKPPFMFEVFSSGDGAAIPLGFTGFSPTVGWAGIGLFVVGVLMIAYAEGPGLALIESITQCFGHVVSYTRIAAVLLAKAGMALAVNLLVFGAYQEGGEFHLIFFEGMPADESLVIFSGLITSSDPVMLIVGGIFGILLLVLGHMLVLVLESRLPACRPCAWSTSSSSASSTRAAASPTTPSGTSGSTPPRTERVPSAPFPFDCTPELRWRSGLVTAVFFTRSGEQKRRIRPAAICFEKLYEYATATYACSESYPDYINHDWN